MSRLTCKLTKALFLTVFTLISITSCGQSTEPNAEESTNPPAVTNQSVKTDSSKNTTKQVEPGSQSNDFSLLVDEPFTRIESDESCDAPIVMEFFAYQCPHCYTLEAQAKKWKDANNTKVGEDRVKFIAIPTHLGREEFGSFLIVHHAADSLGLLNKATLALFDRIHNQKKGFSSPDEAINFLVSLGASQEEAKTAIESDEKIKTAIDESFRLLSKYKIAGVPTIIVNHKYQFDVTKAGGYDKVFEVVNQTLKLESNCSKK